MKYKWVELYANHMGQVNTQELSTRIGCLPATYILVVVSPNLMARVLIGLTRQTHNLSVARTTQEVYSN
jgi:hypothetical protein